MSIIDLSTFKNTAYSFTVESFNLDILLFWKLLFQSYKVKVTFEYSYIVNLTTGSTQAGLTRDVVGLGCTVGQRCRPCDYSQGWPLPQPNLPELQPKNNENSYHIWNHSTDFFFQLQKK